MDVKSFSSTNRVYYAFIPVLILNPSKCPEHIDLVLDYIWHTAFDRPFAKFNRREKTDEESEEE